MSTIEHVSNPVFCALDTPDVAAAKKLAHSLAPVVGGIKLGLEFFCAHGPAGLRTVMPEGVPLFLDLKLHDIPNTVVGAVRSVCATQAHYLTVHAGGGAAMIKAACAAAAEEASRLKVARVKILAVTVLTSLDQTDLAAVGVHTSVADQVKQLAHIAQEAGADGIVCSPHEAATLRAACGPDFVLMVPGVRPRWAAAGDQKRIMTPAEAMAAGSTHLVIGRPITEATNPVDAARRISDELAAGHGN